jgi:hypothetical protein
VPSIPVRGRTAVAIWASAQPPSRPAVTLGTGAQPPWRAATRQPSPGRRHFPRTPMQQLLCSNVAAPTRHPQTVHCYLAHVTVRLSCSTSHGGEANYPISPPPAKPTCLGPSLHASTPQQRPSSPSAAAAAASIIIIPLEKERRNAPSQPALTPPHQPRIAHRWQAQRLSSPVLP